MNDDYTVLANLCWEQQVPRPDDLIVGAGLLGAIVMALQHPARPNFLLLTSKFASALQQEKKIYQMLIENNDKNDTHLFMFYRYFYKIYIYNLFYNDQHL